MNHIILIGFMGAGKTSIGEKLAEALELSFADTDQLIEEQAQMNVADIFAENGEEYFRSLETLTLRQLVGSERRLVISVGGGLPMRVQNQILLKELGMVVYLKAETRTLLYRLSGDTKRPILQGGNLREKITSLMALREPTYEEISAIHIVTDKKSIGKIVEELKSYVS